MRNINYFKYTCVLGALLYLFLFYTLQFKPEKVTSDLGLVGNDVVYLFIKRASILMLAFGVLLFLGRNIEERLSRSVLSASVSICMLGLALMSGVEFAKGNLGAEVIAPLIVESLVGIIFMLLAISNRTRRETETYS